MTASEVLESAPDIKTLDSSISIRSLQLALLQQQYAPTDPLLANNPLIGTPTAELAGLNVSGSDFGSDKVTIGDATSVSLPHLSPFPPNQAILILTTRFKEVYPFRLPRRRCPVPGQRIRPPGTETIKSAR